MIDAVIFDLDGTLCDTITDLANAVNHALEIHGYDTWSVSDVRKFVGNGITKLIECSLPEHERNEKRVMEVRSHFMDFYSKHLLDNTVPYDGIHNCLKALAENKIPISVVTNKAHEQSCELIKALFPDIEFTVIYGNKAGIPHKPDTTLTCKALKAMNASPKNSIFVGDSGVDIQTAHNAGMFGIGVTWGYRPVKDLNGASIIVNTAQELQNAILNRGIN